MIRRPPRSTLFPYRRSSDLDMLVTAQWIAFLLKFLRRDAIALRLVVRNYFLGPAGVAGGGRSEEHTSELQSLTNLVCRLLLEKKKENHATTTKTRENEHQRD